MVKRPQLSDELVDTFQQMHEDVTGTEAASFEQALHTFHRLHHANEGAMAGWNVHGGDEATTTGGRGHAHTIANPDEQAVFKTRLDGQSLRVPEAEIEAFDLADGQLVQVVAYPIETGTETEDGDS